jgi:hypothetical protein
MAYGSINADSIVTSVSGGVLGGGNASIMKNRIINGAMVIDQRNAGASVTPNNTYTLDRWNGAASVASKYTVQQNAGSVTPPAGFSKYLGCTSSSAYSVGASDFFAITQTIEGYNMADLGWGTANAKTITISAWVYSSLTGTFGGSFRGSGRYYPFSYSIPVANTWTQISITIVGDTAGTWASDNGPFGAVWFSLGAGSSFSGTAGAWGTGNYTSATGATSVVGTNGATFYITGVQLEVGSSATGFEYVNYQTSLNNCQRYYQKNICNTGGSNSTPISGTGLSYSTTQAYIPVIFLQAMRATPTLDRSGCKLYEPNAGGGNVSAMALLGSSNISTLLDTTASSLTTARAYWVAPVTASTDYVSFSAEL